MIDYTSVYKCCREKSNETAALGIERTESVIEEQAAGTNEVDADTRACDVIAD